MDKRTFREIESYMLHCMQDAAHDAEHVYRVLYNALDIAGYENDVDYDVLIAACLLHDIGRTQQFKDKKRNHAVEGADMAGVYTTRVNEIVKSRKKAMDDYCKKSISLIHMQSNGEELFSPDLAERIVNGYKFLMPFYDYLVTLDNDPDPREI